MTADNGAAPNLGGPFRRSTTDTSGRFDLDGLRLGAISSFVSKTGLADEDPAGDPRRCEHRRHDPLTRSEGITVHGLDGRTGLPLSSIEALFFAPGGGVAFEDPSHSIPRAAERSRSSRPEVMSPTSSPAATRSAGGNCRDPDRAPNIAFTSGGLIDIRTDAAHVERPPRSQRREALPGSDNAYNFNPQFALAGQTLTLRLTSRRELTC